MLSARNMSSVLENKDGLGFGKWRVFVIDKLKDSWGINRRVLREVNGRCARFFRFPRVLSTESGVKKIGVSTTSNRRFVREGK